MTNPKPDDGGEMKRAQRDGSSVALPSARDAKLLTEGSGPPAVVERVAKAMRKAFNRHDGDRGLIPWEKAAREPRDAWLVCAEAALKALREPTEAMCEAGFEHTGDPCWPKDVGKAWRAMIDAALSSEASPLGAELDATGTDRRREELSRLQHSLALAVEALGRALALLDHCSPGKGQDDFEFIEVWSQIREVHSKLTSEEK